MLSTYGLGESHPFLIFTSTPWDFLGVQTCQITRLQEADADFVNSYDRIISCGLFGNLTGWILEKKVGSKALDFVFRLYFQLVYVGVSLPCFTGCALRKKLTDILYLDTTLACVLCKTMIIPDRLSQFEAETLSQRTLFARLRKAEQFLYIQLLSSIWIITFYPAWMSRTAYRLFKWLFGAERTYAEHAESVAMNLYVRNLSENVTMVA